METFQPLFWYFFFSFWFSYFVLKRSGKYSHTNTNYILHKEKKNMRMRTSNSNRIQYILSREIGIISLTFLSFIQYYLFGAKLSGLFSNKVVYVREKHRIREEILQHNA